MIEHAKTRKVLVEFRIKLPMDVPEHWDSGIINHHFNDSCWCASNLADTINKLSEDGNCICFMTEAEYLGEHEEDDVD